MAIEKFQFLDKQSVELLALQLLNKSQTRFNERIVTKVDTTSTDKQFASARALYKFIQSSGVNAEGIAEGIDEHDVQLGNHNNSLSNVNTQQANQDTKLTNLETDLDNLESLVSALTHITYQSVIGDISTVTNPSPNILYLQKDNEDDPSWMIYTYHNGKWINVGDTETDLSVIWSKDEVAELREALGIHEVEAILDDDILAIIEDTYSESEEDFSPVTEE